MKRLCCWLVLLAGLSAHAAQLYVDASGNHQFPYDSWHKAAHDIQTAVDAAPPGATVWVADGTYTVDSGARVVHIDKALSLRGASGNRDAVVIDAQHVSGRRGIYALLSEPDDYLLIEGLSVVNGLMSTRGAGVYIHHTTLTGTALVHNCVIANNTNTAILGTSRNGGGIVFEGESGTEFVGMISQSHLHGNTAHNGGGGYFIDTRGIIDGCLIAHNTATGDNSGGFRVSRGDIVRNTIFEYNHGGSWAGAMELSADVLMENCIFRHNSAGNGGALFLRNAVSLPIRIHNCLFHDNTGSSGGVLYLRDGASAEIVNSTMTANSRAIYMNSDCPLSLINSIVYHNSSYDISGVLTGVTAHNSCTTAAVPGTSPKISEVSLLR